MDKSELPLGKVKCRMLRELRIRFAQQNNIEYHPAECHHHGDCKGTCPACDEELKFLNETALNMKQKGIEIKYPTQFVQF